MKTIHAIVSGKVQGVYFRAYTQEKAESLDLTGWVRNLSTGDVELMATGTEENIQALIDWLYIGSPSSSVSKVKALDTNNTQTNHLAEFAIWPTK